MSILTVAEFREHVSTELGDAAVQRLLDAAEEAIVARAGAAGARTELSDGGFRFISLSRPAASISSVVETVDETSTTLATDDYSIGLGEMVLERLDTGTNPRSTWNDLVAVTYTPVADTATRQEVQIELVKLALNYAPGIQQERIGEWAQQFGFSGDWTPEAEREAILARLNVSLGMVVV